VTETERYAAEPGMTRLLAAVAERHRALGRVGGAVVLEQLSPPEARTLRHLSVTGRTLPQAGGKARVELARLDRALADVGGLLAVLRAAGHDVTTAVQRREEAASLLEAAWARALDAAAGSRTPEWVDDLRRTRGGAPPLHLPTALAALEILESSTMAWDRARLATEAAGDPHALDDGTPAAALLLAAFAHRDGTPVPAGASARRALLARHGVLCDPHSSTVLVLGLRATGRGPAAKLLAAADGAHTVLTLAQLAASELSAVRGVVRTCEGPVVVRAAEERLGTRLNAPLVCTDGQPSAACDILLRRLGGAVAHSGDFEWGGLRIASLMRRRHGAVPWRHDVTDYDAAVALLPDRVNRLGSPRGAAPEGIEMLWRALDECRVPIWQEDLLDRLVDDLADG
jgi:uncharacterized protein (TIGR02679 family)